MSFKNKIEEIMEEAVQSSLNTTVTEATLKVGSFTGKTDDGSNADSVNEPGKKKGGLRSRVKIKKVGSGQYGGDKVVITGSEEDLISYGKRHLGGEGDTLSAVQSSIGEAAKLDAVGKGDDDIDNDGDVDSSDEYLKNRRKKIGKSIDSAKLKEMAKASKTEHIKGGLEKGADGYSAHQYHRIAIALAGGTAAYQKMPYGTGQSYRDKAKTISNSEKDRILSQPTPR